MNARSDAALMSHVLKRFNATNPKQICKTDLATIWKAQRARGAPIAIKLYRDAGFDDETNAPVWLALHQGLHAVTCLAVIDTAMVFEWLEGPSLGETARQGDLRVADDRLIALASALHNEPHPSQQLTPIRQVFEGLFTLRFGAGCPVSLRDDLSRASLLAKTCLAQAQDRFALHGDLHHDNVVATARGDLAIDPKGVAGPIGYELANTFRNPQGCPLSVSDPDRAMYLASQAAAHLPVSAQQQLNWAAAHAALSIAWDVDGVMETNHREAPLLSMLLSLANPP